MASQWRIRHKLMLGLGLIVAVIALLLGGASRGLYSYYLTTSNIRLKQNELVDAEELKSAIYELMDPFTLPSLAADPRELDQRLSAARSWLASYEEKLRDTMEQGNDMESADHALGLVEVLREELGQKDEQGKFIPGKFQQALGMATRPQAVPVGNALFEENLRKELTVLVARPRQVACDLRNHIKEQLDQSLHETRRHYQKAFWMIGPASIVGLLVLAGLLRSFYDWILHPIRELEGGVQRVAQGNFDHPIILNSGDEMEDLAAAFNDMTRRLDGLYKDLTRQVNERSRQLVRSERLASVGFLAAGVAHEINNPLASIAFCSEALESRLHDLFGKLRTSEDKQVFVKYLKMIQEEAFRCKNITERLLAFSRTGERRREPVDLAVLVQSVLDVTQHLQNSKGKRIAFEMHPERQGGRIVAPINAEEIKSVVLNLVVNALDSMDEGGRLSICLTQRDGMAALEVTDTGCGMSQEVLENIFEPFFTRSRTGKGTGLGLTISHRIVNQHGGEIDAASPGPGMGSTFTIRLPLQVSEPTVMATGPELRRAA